MYVLFRYDSFINRFADEPDPVSNPDSYSWNPCQPFSEGDCKNVAVRFTLYQNDSIAV
jgi:hypothetical protein